MKTLKYKKTMKSLRYFSRRANKEMLDQKADNTKTSNQIDICVASSSKQEDRAKNQELKRPIQIEQDKGGRNTRGTRRNYRTKWPFKRCFLSLWLKVPEYPETTLKKQGQGTSWEKTKNLNWNF